MRSYLSALCFIGWLLQSGGLWAKFEHGDVVESKRGAFRIEDVVTSGLKQPWAIAFLPEGGFLVNEKGGALWLIEEGGSSRAMIAGLPEIAVLGQGGLLDLELHPKYEETGWIYISYSKPLESDKKRAMTCLVRAKLDREAMRLTDMETLFEVEESKYFSKKRVHFGTRTVFDPEGYMYFSMGDRGHQDRAQELDWPNGNVFRLHDDGRIPKDNPFVNKRNAVKAIWSYGHRNPQGMAVHPETGEIWAIEHGPRGGDELNWVRKGLNYGWPEITYGINYNGTPITDKTELPGMEQPVKYWVPSPAPCGMDIYSGDAFPAWKNHFFIANLRSEKLIRLELNEHCEVVDEEDLLEGVGRLRDVETGPDGNIWVLAEQPGRIFKLVPVE